MSGKSRIRMFCVSFSAQLKCREVFALWGTVRSHCPQGRMALGSFMMLGLLLAGLPSWAFAEVVVIGHESWGATTGFDKNLVGRIFTGRAVQVAGMSVQPVNMKTGDATRTVFIKEILKQSDDDYVAYWIVRRAIGKGTPPVEMESAQEMIGFVRSTPGAIGYIDASQLRPGINTLLILP